MNQGKISKFLAVVLLVAMTLSLMPATVAFAEDTATWEKVALADISESDTIAISMLKDSTYYFLPNAATTRQPSATGLTEDNVTVANLSPDSFGWTISKNGDSLTISSGSNYLYKKGDAATDLRVGGTSATWIVDEDYLKLEGTIGRPYAGVRVASSDWRCYADKSGSGNISGETLQFWRLTDSSAPTHEHEWGDWTSNDDGTHYRSCAAADCPVGTQTENCSYDEGTVTAEPTCVDEGVKHFTCTVCGYEKDETIPATGEHTDADGDGACDVCGEAMPTATVFTLGTEVHEGDQVVIYYPASSLALSVNASGTKLAGTAASISGEELTVLSNDTATAVLTVEFADATNFYLKTADGKYLTTGATGNSLSFAAEASDYALWYLETADASAKTVYIRSTNAAYNGNKNQAMEYYSGFTVYSIKTTNIYKFQLFILANPNAHVHDWTGTVTTEPTCTAKGVMTYTCSGCDESYTEEIPMVAHADADGDGLCDSCHGTIYNQAETLNDGDRLILVTGAFGKAMTGTASGNYMAAADVNAQAGVTVPAADDNVWTVKTAEGGFYLVNSEGQYLYVTEIDGKAYLALGDETTDNRVWKIADPVEGLTATGAYLVNEGGKYIEYGANYKNYQTYGAPTANYETWYAFTFYTLPAAETEEVAKVYGYSISTSGNIAINVYLQLPAELAENGSITVNGTAYAPANVAEETPTGTYYKVSAAVSAKDINTPITVKVLDGEDQEVTLYKSTGEEIGAAYETSVANYLTWQAENSSDESLTKLVKALFNYGSYAGYYWNVIDTLPTLYTGEGLDAASVTDLSTYASVAEAAEDTKGVTLVGASVTLKSETSLRIYFTAKDTTNLKVYLATGSNYADGAAVAAAGEEVSYTLKSGKTYFVEIPNISASKLDESYSFTVCVKDAEGNDVYPVVLKNVSALSYANKVLETSTDANLQNVVRALYLYNQAANPYFEH